MSQDLFRTSPEKMRIQVPFMSFSALKSLWTAIVDFKKTKGPSMSSEQVNHVERMQTIVESEFYKRIDFNVPENSQDLTGWQMKNYKRKKYH